MGDLISREGAKLKVARKLVELKKDGASWSDLALCALDAIDDVPSVDAEPVRQGEWQYSVEYCEDAFDLFKNKNFAYRVDARCPFCGNGWKVEAVFLTEVEKEFAKREVTERAIRKAEDFRFCCGCGANLRGGRKMHV